MRWLAILTVYLYRLVLRRLLRRLRRRRCLYDESCSTFALRVLRERGFVTGVRQTRARLRSCRLPVSASFVLDEHGRARLLAATSADGQPVPARALEHLAARAEQSVRGADAP
jgi:putative component of membrane protein insertase Oxa1/YidC/SpoIIIJ protein YidD